MSGTLRRAFPVLVGVALISLSVFTLRREFHAVSLRDLTADVRRTPPGQLALAVSFVALNYLCLAGYELLAIRAIGRRLPAWKVAITASLAYAVSNNVGFSVVSGTSVRYRFYSRWGLSADELPRIVLFNWSTFWLGFLVLAGLSVANTPLPDWVPIHGGARVVAGWCLVAASPAYVVAAAWNLPPLRLGPVAFTLPSASIAFVQLMISLAEWSCAAAVLYSLLPDVHLPFVTFVGAFVLAILLGMVSHVPGGVGVFESLLVLLLKPYLTVASLLPALVVFRAAYYLLPFFVALAVLIADALRTRRSGIDHAMPSAGEPSA